MPKLTKVRDMTEDENKLVKQLAHSRIKPAHIVQRARIVLWRKEGKSVGQIAEELRVSARTVRRWVERFNALGMEGLQDANRTGRPPTYTQGERGEVIAAALTDPQSLGLPFGSWTLDRLEAYLNQEKQIPIKRSRIADMLVAEGLRWRTQERWFTEKAQLDPQFVEKRGPSSPSTPSLLLTHRG